MKIGYMRVSSESDRQNTDLQRDALLQAGVDPQSPNLKCKIMSYILICKTLSYIYEVAMARTMTVDLGNELRHYVESLVDSGDYRSNSEVLRESLRLLREKQAKSKLEQLRHLIDEGEASGDPLTWDAKEFLMQMKKKSNAK